MSEDEDKIVIETKLAWYEHSSYTKERTVSFLALQAVLAELYQKGIEIGWETKILDPLNDKLRKLLP
jgi:hypothetical protein